MAETFERYTEVARAMLLNAPISEHTISSYEHDVKRFGALFGRPPAADAADA
jgi:site-specific recombinase XerD